MELDRHSIVDETLLHRETTRNIFYAISIYHNLLEKNYFYAMLSFACSDVEILK